MKRSFKVLIFILAGLVIFQAVSISILWVKNVRLKAALAKRVPKAVGTIALVLDDWGYNKRNLAALFNIDQPITISILPNLPFSKSIANQAHTKNIEIVLHLPLEPHDWRKPPEKTTIYTYMSQKDILERLQSALDSVPYAKGVSNHMGSKATEDEKFMKFLFEQFKKKNLYFLDSLVTNNSVCSKVATVVGIKFAERSVFLDNNNEAEYIRNQLQQLMTLAKEKKSAIGIGHARALTIKTISQMLAEFQREGIKLVYLSELVK